MFRIISTNAVRIKFNEWKKLIWKSFEQNSLNANQVLHFKIVFYNF